MSRVKFKCGDRVVCILPSSMSTYLKKGADYIITHIDDDGFIIFDECPKEVFSQERFDLSKQHYLDSFYEQLQAGG